MCLGVLSACFGTPYECLVPMETRRACRMPSARVMALSHHVVARDGTWVIRKAINALNRLAMSPAPMPLIMIQRGWPALLEVRDYLKTS